MKESYLKKLLYVIVALTLLLIFYKTYLIIFESDFQANNMANIKKIERQTDGNTFSFAVLGNIENSIDIFDKKMINKLNNDRDLNFVISTGNAVFDGSEDKYRLLNKSLNKLEIPAIVGIGNNEITDEGSDRFYKHFGPFYFSFDLNKTYFIFLDTTGKTAFTWQEEWLKKELNAAQDYQYRFVFMNRAPFETNRKVLFKNKSNYIKNKDFRDFLIDTFSKYNVTGVFATGSPGVFKSRKIQGVDYFLSGGGGGGILTHKENSFYHFLKITVKPDEVSYSVIKQETPATYYLMRRLENIWTYIHSLFYIDFINFIIIIGILILLGITIYLKVTKEVDYYRDFDDSNQEISPQTKLNIAMFTNNYLPFIGGVPISIERLVKGLEKRGHNVSIFAPEYPDKKVKENKNIIRCKLLTYYKTSQFKFAITNIFSPDIDKEFLKRDIDIVHAHHPFWMGTKGLKLGKKYDLPVILTYHTRLEKYSHVLPFFKLFFKNILSHKIIRRFSQKCNTIIAPTRTAREYLQNIGVSRRKVVLPTGIDFDYYNRVTAREIKTINKKLKSENEIVLCSVSRLSKEKNIYFLLKAVKYIKKHTEMSFKCIIIGDGPEKKNLLKEIKKQKLENTVKLVGAVPHQEIPKYYQASDIFVFSSQSETQGMVILEAMAGKTPVVAIRSSGIDDVIKNEYNGFKTRGEIEDWADKVIYLMENQTVLCEMSSNAYNFSRRFSVDRMAEKVEKVYYKAIRDMKK